MTRPAVPPAVSVGPKAEKPDAATALLLEKAGRYVADYERSFSNLVAEETYTQRTEQVTPERDAPLERRRSLRSDIVFVTLPGPIPWGTFRDVFEVDGRPIRDRQARLQSLFAKPPADALVRANAILRESARYNLGSARRTVNIPTLALLFLHPANQERFAFKTKGRARIQGHEAVVLEFKEIARPTLVRESSQGDLPAKGRFWLDPDRGIVLRSEVEYRFEPNRALAWVATEFRAELGLEVLGTGRDEGALRGLTQRQAGCASVRHAGRGDRPLRQLPALLRRGDERDSADPRGQASTTMNDAREDDRQSGDETMRRRSLNAASPRAGRGRSPRWAVWRD